MNLEEMILMAFGYIKVEYLVLIPTIFGLGKIIKHTKLIPDEYIPTILMLLGIALSYSLGGISAHSLIQGVIATTVTVWGNEATTQLIKRKEG